MEENKKSPLISIVIPLYNKEKVVEAPLKSIKGQTFIPYELIIVNDGSTDNSRDVVLHYINSNSFFADRLPIKIIDQENGGVSSARNRGIKEANGEYIAFIDADDEWRPDFLNEISKLIETFPDCSLYATSYVYKTGLNSFKPISLRGFNFNEDIGIIDNYFKMATAGEPPICSSAVVVRKSVISSIGGFPPIKMGEDLIVWAKIACQYKIAYNKNTLSVYSRLPENYLTDSYHGEVVPSHKNDLGGKLLDELYQNNSHIDGLKSYCYFWHKMRLVLLVEEGRKFDAFREWYETIPEYLFNLDCYYRLFLNFLHRKGRLAIKKIVGKN